MKSQRQSGNAVHHKSSVNSLRQPGSLGAEREKSLARLGLRNLREVFEFEPLKLARSLLAVSRGLLPITHLDHLVKEEFMKREPHEAVSWPITALHGINDHESRVLAEIGIKTVGDLAQLGDEVEEDILTAASENGFQERPSAPAQLLPGLVGSIATSVRFTTFISDTDLRHLKLKTDPDCDTLLPITGNLTGYGEPKTLLELIEKLKKTKDSQEIAALQDKLKKATSGNALAAILKNYASAHQEEKVSLSSIFESQKCPVIHLGYLCDHRQQWINLGTHLGEVVHSLSLAPGENRNIALVNWRRRQLTKLEERTTTNEQLTATFVQNRALEEITSAVASEHQSGSTQSEANTSVTAASFVAAGAVVGGIAGGLTGTGLGAAIGSVVPALGTAIGAVGGGAVGSILGGAAGSAAGGLVYSGARAFGTIEADTGGDRDIVASVHQRISLSASQNASSVRSLWSTVVVEDAQAESVEATTSNITNYNHMHTLNIEYYEVLQHYLARIELERVQPLLYLPFTFLDFTNFRFIRDYWDIVRLYVEDEGLREQGDSYFVTEGPPEAPDLLPLPPVPVPPTIKASLIIKKLKVDVLFKSLPLNTDINLALVRGNAEIDGTETENGVPQGDLDGYEWGNRYTYDDIDDAQEITGFNLSKHQVIDMDIRYRIRIFKGEIQVDGQMLENLKGEVIASNEFIPANNHNQTFSIAWNPAKDFSEDDAQAQADYKKALKESALVAAKNAARRAAYETLVENIERFRQRLQRLVLRRRHFFTSVILNAIEPEEISQLLEALTIQNDTSESSAVGIPLSAIAHTIPLGMTNDSFVLKLKRLDKNALQSLFEKLGRKLDLDNEKEELKTLLQYADQTLTHYEGRKANDPLVQAEHIYVPTGGLFAEAILGRSNSAEYLDIERFFNWNDSPIPQQAPEIQAVGTESRFQQGNVSVTLPDGNLQLINPVPLPDPSGLQGVLSAIQSPNLFRDMSKATELAGIIAGLATLAGQMGQAASTMTGQAAQQAMQAATDVGKTAAGMAQAMLDKSFDQTGSAFNTLTSQGAVLNKAREFDQAATPNGSGANGSTPGDGNPLPGNGAKNFPLSEDVLRKSAGLSTRTASTHDAPFASTQRTALLVFQENSGNLGTTVFGPLLDNLDASTKKNIEDKVDFFVEEFEKAFSGFADAAGREYNRVEFLEDATAIPSAFKERMKILADQGFSIDIITIGHGSDKRLVGFQGASITDVTLSELKSEYGRALPIRMVYMMNCRGSSMNSAWVDAGATVSGGSRGDNWMPEPMLRTFWKNWLGGMNFAHAIADAYHSTKGFWKIIYNDLGMIPAGIDVNKVLDDSEPIFIGDGNASIGTNIRLVPDAITV
jgi:hypothetical protein